MLQNNVNYTKNSLLYLTETDTDLTLTLTLILISIRPVLVSMSMSVSVKYSEPPDLYHYVVGGCTL